MWVGLAFKLPEGLLASYPSPQEGNPSRKKKKSSNVGEGGTVTQAKNRSRAHTVEAEARGEGWAEDSCSLGL